METGRVSDDRIGRVPCPSPSHAGSGSLFSTFVPDVVTMLSPLPGRSACRQWYPLEAGNALCIVLGSKSYILILKTFEPIGI